MLEWTNSRTGPLTEAVGHQIIWTRLPADSEPLTLHGPDPSSGPDAPHIELIAMVRCLHAIRISDRYLTCHHRTTSEVPCTVALPCS